ncbi:MAG: ATP-binding protein [Treponema sp.]|nr:ATP-binding protein [Treponema sp.]
MTGFFKNKISIRTWIFLVIAATALFINVSFLTAGILILTQKTGGMEYDIFAGLLLTCFITLFLSIFAFVLAALILKRPLEEAELSKKAEDNMSVSKSAFFAKINREIRTPMNSIVGFSELALDSESSLKTRDYLNKIRTNAQWLLQIINDVLDISKAESGKMELENIPFEMHELFSSCRTLMLPKAVEKGLTLYFYVEPSIGKRPMGDPTRLLQILINLLSNAIKFTNTGMIKLHAVLKHMEENTITMYFEIKDSGIGMTSEQVKTILDPLLKTGLGLSITRNIIELMGGKLSVESSPGIGSKFSFELVFDTVNTRDDDMFEQKVVINELEKPAFEGEILLCEDNHMNQQVICEHLRRVGLKTIVAENGKMGLDLVKERMIKKQKQFDLVFMDMHMPVMDGLEASLKIMELNTGVPVVAMTANIMFNDRDIYRKSGMNDCVGKPFTSQELWRCLMKYLTPTRLIKERQSTQIETDVHFQKDIQAAFVKNNKKIYDEITAAMENGDLKQAKMLSHTLKSNAGHVGKIILQKAAASIENQLKDGKNLVTEEQLRILKTELEMVINEFS